MTNPLQYSSLEYPVDRGAWTATVHGVAKSQTWLKWLIMHARTLSDYLLKEEAIPSQSFFVTLLGFHICTPTSIPSNPGQLWAWGIRSEMLVHHSHMCYLHVLGMISWKIHGLYGTLIWQCLSWNNSVSFWWWLDDSGKNTFFVVIVAF